jgi:hypothetical protein
MLGGGCQAATHNIWSIGNRRITDKFTSPFRQLGRLVQLQNIFAESLAPSREIALTPSDAPEKLGLTSNTLRFMNVGAAEETGGEDPYSPSLKRHA